MKKLSVNAATPPMSVERPRAVAEKPVILVVDDEPANLAVLSHLLQAEYTVRVARGGERALSLAASERPALILLDVEMPDLDGYEVCRKLKHEPATAAIPVIFLTGRSSVEDEQRGFGVGAVDYIHKPISPPILLARFATQIALQRALLHARAAQQRADELLEVILPPVCAEELRATATIRPRRIESAAVLFADVVEFTSYCDRHSPEEVVDNLHRVFTRFEEIAREFGVEKIKTIGDGFMAGVGLLTPSPEPLLAAARCGVRMVEEIHALSPGWKLRVGIHEGPVVAGIVGTERYQFDIWGDTVNLAARLAQTSLPNRVSMVAELYPRVARWIPGVAAGARPMKGKGLFEVVDLLGADAVEVTPLAAEARARG